MEHNAIERPMTKEEVSAALDRDGYITGFVAISLTELIEQDRDYLLDEMSIALIGTKKLYDIDFNLIGPLEEEDYVLFRVKGKPLPE